MYIQVIRSGNQLITDLFVKSTDTHQYLHASSCHVYHFKRAIPYSQTLRFVQMGYFLISVVMNWKEWLGKRGYSDKMVRQQILRARKFGRNELLNKEKNSPTENKLVVNITYHPAYSRVKEVLTQIYTCSINT